RGGREERPWFAIGGVDALSLPAVVGAGATRIAVVRAVAGPAPGASVRGLMEAFERSPVP
ncbi:MAG: hypothetical protein ACHQ4F_15385, partial [Candidatus Dormibacteria bacterium]